MRLFVGNLAWSITEEELERIFAPYGTVRSVYLLTHRETGRSRGFGFVEMPYDTEAQDAIAGLHASWWKAAPSSSVRRTSRRAAGDHGGRGAKGLLRGGGHGTYVTTAPPPHPTGSKREE